MSYKQQSSQKLIFKINSSRLRKANWNLDLTFQEAQENGEIVALAESTTLRFIREINGEKFSEDEIKFIKKQIKTVKKLEKSEQNTKEIRRLYSELNNKLFVKDYMFLVMANNKDFDRACKGFSINGIKYKRLLATTGGAKKNTVVFVNEKIHSELSRRIDNGRDLTKSLVPGKLEAYKALTCSASIPVSSPKGILVVKDCETTFFEDIIKIDDSKEGYPRLTYEKNEEIKLVDSDGYGLILPELSKKWGEDLQLDYLPSGFCIRNSFCKGMVFTFDFRDFADKLAKTEMVQDVWGNWYNIKDIQMILTVSMLKLWDSYKNIEHYLQCCEENGYTFSVTKVTPKELESERTLNYQFIQSLNLTDEDIKELIKPTVDELHDVLGGDYRKSILFLRGKNITEHNVETNEYDFIKALMIDKRMKDDPFVKSKIHRMIKKRINEAKVGVLNVRGNFSIVSGDPYSLCQSIFDMNVTGLLKKGKYYSKYWNDLNVKKVAAFRAPMTCHNNIRILNIDDTEEMQYWYRYMTTVTILNSHDTLAHAMNGLDKDSDIILTTDNPIIIGGIEELPAILCVQKNATKKVVEEKDLIQANKNSFGEDIGSITNRITSMFAIQSIYDKDSKEYNELQYRIMCGQNFQQNAIDKIKGIISKPMPKEWYDYKSNKILDTDSKEEIERKRFNLSILAEKKPYFMNYVYPHQMHKYNKFVKNANENCMMRFGLSVETLRNKKNLTMEEEKFLKYYDIKMPVCTYPSIMNKICWNIEKEFENNYQYDDLKFDYTILKSSTEYDNNTYNKIKDLYYSYKEELKQFSRKAKKERIFDEDKNQAMSSLKEHFKEAAFSICNNEDILCNIVLDLCYTNNDTKQFAWDISGEQIIKNLLSKNNNIINYPTLDVNGDIEYGGFKFSMQQKEIKEGDNE